MDTLYEMAGYTLPSLVVFATVYVILRQYFRQQIQLEQVKVMQSNNQATRPLRFQAYERLVMFCERITIDNLYFRISHPDMGGQELKNAMLIAVQQEFEHNLTQQLYVSEDLWSIILAVKDQVHQVIAASSGQTQEALLTNMKEIMSKLSGDPMQMAKVAIRNEVRSIM